MFFLMYREQILDIKSVATASPIARGLFKKVKKVRKTFNANFPLTHKSASVMCA